MEQLDLLKGTCSILSSVATILNHKLIDSLAEMTQRTLR